MQVASVPLRTLRLVTSQPCEKLDHLRRSHSSEKCFKVLASAQSSRTTSPGCHILTAFPLGTLQSLPPPWTPWTLCAALDTVRYSPNSRFPAVLPSARCRVPEPIASNLRSWAPWSIGAQSNCKQFDRALDANLPDFWAAESRADFAWKASEHRHCLKWPIVGKSRPRGDLKSGTFLMLPRCSTSHHSRSAGHSPPQLWIAMTTKSLVMTVFSRAHAKVPVPTRCNRAAGNANALAGPRFFSLVRQCYSRSCGKQRCGGSHARSSPSVDRALVPFRSVHAGGLMDTTTGL